MVATLKRAKGLYCHAVCQMRSNPQHHRLRHSRTGCPIFPVRSHNSSCVSQFLCPQVKGDESRMGKGRCSPSSIPCYRFPSQLRGNTGLVLPRLCLGWCRGCRRTLAIPRQICCGSKFLPCSTYIDITPLTVRATAWKMSVVLEKGAASSAE